MSNLCVIESHFLWIVLIETAINNLSSMNAWQITSIANRILVLVETWCSSFIACTFFKYTQTWLNQADHKCISCIPFECTMNYKWIEFDIISLALVFIINCYASNFHNYMYTYRSCCSRDELCALGITQVVFNNSAKHWKQHHSMMFIIFHGAFFYRTCSFKIWEAKAICKIGMRNEKNDVQKMEINGN